MVKTFIWKCELSGKPIDDCDCKLCRLEQENERKQKEKLRIALQKNADFNRKIRGRKTRGFSL